MIRNIFMQMPPSFFHNVFWFKTAFNAHNTFFSSIVLSSKKLKHGPFPLSLWQIVLCVVITTVFFSFPAIAARKCPTGIYPAENGDELVDNMFNFLLDIYHKKIVPLNEDIIHCYFSGEIKWSYSNDDSYSYDEYEQKPDKWNSIKIEKIIAEKNYLLEYDADDNYLLLNGKDRDFDPLPLLLRRFSHFMVDKDYHSKGLTLYGNSFYGGLESPIEGGQEWYEPWQFASSKLESEGVAKIPGLGNNKFYGFIYKKGYSNSRGEYKKYKFMFQLKASIYVKCLIRIRYHYTDC